MVESLETTERRADAGGIAESIAATGLQVSQAADDLRQAAERLMRAEELAREAELQWRTAEEQLAKGAAEHAGLVEASRSAREAQAEADERARRAEEALQEAIRARDETEERVRHVEQSQQEAVREAETAAQERARRAEEALREALQARTEADERARRAEESMESTLQARTEADERARRAEERLEEAVREAEAAADERARRAEQRQQIAIERARLMEEQLHDLESRIQEAEARPQVTVIVDDERTALQEAVAADVRRPLTSILGLTLALKHADPQSSEGSDMIRQLATNARKLDRLVGEMLAVDKIANGVFEPNLRRTDLEALVCRVVDESSDLANRDVKVESEHVAIQVDPALTEQMVETLLSNAGRRTAPGNTVWVKVSSDQGGAVIAVDDTGPEVPSGLRGAMVAALTDQGPAARHRPRGATGLTLLSRLAEIHGGRAWVEERPGGGASFRVFLPAEREPHEEPRHASADDRAAARVLDGSDERAVALARALVNVDHEEARTPSDRTSTTSPSGREEPAEPDLSGEIVL